MPGYTNPMRMLDSLRKPALLDYEDQFQEGFPSNTGGSVVQKDPSVVLEAFNQNMLSELREREFNATRTGNRPNAAALRGLSNAYQNDIDTSPLAAQRAQVAGIQGANTKAQTLGFADSAEAGRYNRSLQQRDLELKGQQIEANSPVAAARVQGENAMKLERERSQNMLANLRALGEQQTQGAPVNRMAKTAQGGWSVGFDTNGPGASGDPKAISGAMTLAAQAARARAGAMSGDPQAAAMYEGLKAQALSARTDIDPTVRDFVAYAVDSPEYEGMSADEVQQFISETQDVSQVTPQEWVQFKELFRAFREPQQ